MAVTAVSAVPDLLWKSDITIVTAQGTGTINVGDYVSYSGHRVFASNSGFSAFWKASGLGVALECSPVYDQAGRTAINTGLKVLTQGIIRVSGGTSGSGTLGLGAFPIATGSGVAAPTGLTGIGALWSGINPVIASGATAGEASPVAKIIGVNMAGGQTAQFDLLLLPVRPDLYG